MFLRWRVVLCAIVLLSILDVRPVIGKRSYGGSHSYPRSGGLSGGGSHSYPKSTGLSGGGHGYPSSGGHGYPSSGGLSGGSHGYPSSGGSHGYPSPGGSRGYPSSGGSHSYPSSGGSHGYPASGGLSGNNRGQTSNKYPSGGTHTTNIHNHYHYTPPQQIRYTPVGGGPPVNYPVYRGTPPTYVYQMKDSGSKYGTLLTGLALLNLGALAGTAYAVTHNHNGGGSSGTSYKAQPGEICKFGLKKDNGDYEETRIDCQLISSFILQEEAKAQNNATNTTIVTTVTNVTTVNVTNGVPEVVTTTEAPGNRIYMMLANGTLVPLNGTNVASNNATANAPESSPNNTATSSVTVTTTTTNTTVTNALDVKGKPIDVTPGMQCFVMRTTPTSRMKKSVPCGVLQTYAEKSIKKNSAGRNIPTFTLLAAVVALCLS